jgi:proteasome-associated ATPase
LHWKDFVSGALLKSVVDRAKDSAIRRAVADGANKAGITKQDLDDALRDEYREGEIFPKNDGVDDWLRLLDIDPADVATVHSIRERLPSDSYRRTVL